jgi:hypothetical protein
MDIKYYVPLSKKNQGMVVEIWTLMTSQSAKPVTASHDINVQKSTTLLKKLINFSDSQSRKIKH